MPWPLPQAISAGVPARSGDAPAVGCCYSRFTRVVITLTDVSRLPDDVAIAICRDFFSSDFFTHVFQEAILQALLRAIVLSLTLTAPALAEKLVDPTTVAPEYREAAEKRRAEQIKQHECAKKADQDGVMPRERAAFVLQCLETDAQK